MSIVRQRWYGRIREELYPQLDIKRIIAEKEAHCKNISLRKVSSFDFGAFEHLYERHCHLQTVVNQLRAIRKQQAKEFYQRKLNSESREIHATDNNASVADELSRVEREQREVEDELRRLSLWLPNTSHPSTPPINEEVEVFGGPAPKLPIHPTPKVPSEKVDHLAWGKELGILDFEAGARVAGSRFFFLTGWGALLENALVQFALKMAIEAGFKPILPPDIVNSKYIHACGFFPRTRKGDNDEEDEKSLPVYTASVDGQEEVNSPLQVLAATGEIPMAALNSGQVLSTECLPLKWVGVSHCFRPETGHHGAESRGLYRVHQFTKVELFVTATPDESELYFDEIITLQKRIFSSLGLHCRLLRMAHDELGNGAYQKYDIETWYPSRGWGEISSASNCSDYQSRRLAIKYRPKNGDKLAHPHTLNGTAAAIPRLLQALIETNTQRLPDGTLTMRIPDVLHPFMLDGSQEISSKALVASSK